ncbi:MAG: cation transporter [Planctomycetota bacterium]
MFSFTRFAFVLFSVVGLSVTLAGCARESGAEASEPVVFEIEGMTCDGCVRTVLTALRQVPGVQSAEVSLEKEQAFVVADANGFDEKSVLAAVRDAGYQAKRAVPAATAVAAVSPPIAAETGSVPASAAVGDKRALLVNITRGKEDLHAVSMALALAQKALDDGRRSSVFLNVAAPVFAAKDLADDVKYADFPPVKQMLAEFMKAGGTLLVCQHCAHVSGLKDEDLIEGVVLSKQTELLEEIDRGGAVFSY